MVTAAEFYRRRGEAPGMAHLIYAVFAGLLTGALFESRHVAVGVGIATLVLGWLRQRLFQAQTHALQMLSRRCGGELLPGSFLGGPRLRLTWEGKQFTLAPGEGMASLHCPDFVWNGGAVRITSVRWPQKNLGLGGPAQVDLGDAEFRQHFRVQADDAQGAGRLLTPELQTALLAQAHRGKVMRAWVDSGGFRLDDNQPRHREEDLENMLELGQLLWGNAR